MHLRPARHLVAALLPAAALLCACAELPTTRLDRFPRHAAHQPQPDTVEPVIEPLALDVASRLSYPEPTPRLTDDDAEALYIGVRADLGTHLRDTSAGDFVTQWNRRHGDRFVFHYTPTHGSWLNQIELWFGILARRVLKHGSFESVDELERAVMAFIEQWNKREAHPFRWTYEGTPLAA